MKDTIQVEIWSDVVCPFCYIGKRHFEQAVAQLPAGTPVQVTWKSFQLNPEQKTDTSITIYQSLAQSKGWTEQYTRQTTQHVTTMAAQAGLQYDFDKVVVANTLNAHRMIHLAADYGKADDMKERLLKGYFTEGMNVDDDSTLVDLALELGIPKDEAEDLLKTDRYAFEVQKDIAEAAQIGVRGVPFFVFDRKYAVSGAQPVEAFVQTLEQVSKEKITVVSNSTGASCTPEGQCD